MDLHKAELHMQDYLIFINYWACPSKFNSKGKGRMMKAFLKSGFLSLALLTAMLVSSCGTILYPERQGQKGDKVDVNVVLMDGIGLFFFLVPGIIAFVVERL